MPLDHPTHQRRELSYRRARIGGEANIDQRSSQIAQVLAGIASAAVRHVPVQTDEGIGRLSGEVSHD